MGPPDRVSPPSSRRSRLKKEEGGEWHAVNCLKELRRYDEAIQYGEKLVASDPEGPAPYRALALSYLAAGRQQEARVLPTKAIRHFEGVQETALNARNASFLWQIRPEMGVPTLTSKPVYQTLEARLQKRVEDLDNR